MTDAYTPVLTAESIVGILHNTPLAPKEGHHIAFARAIERAAIEGYQQKISQQPETPREIADALRDLSGRMLTVGLSMVYYGGIDRLMVGHGAEMVRASHIAVDWADNIDSPPPEPTS